MVILWTLPDPVPTRLMRDLSVLLYNLCCNSSASNAKFIESLEVVVVVIVRLVWNDALSCSTTSDAESFLSWSNTLWVFIEVSNECCCEEKLLACMSADVVAFGVLHIPLEHCD